MDRRDRLWFVVSTVTAIPVGMILGVPLVRWSHQLGYRVGAGEHGPDRLAWLVESEPYRFAVLAAAVLIAVSAFAWWRFSIRQDELFNRIQNYALGHASAWTLAVAIVWWTLSLGGWVDPLPLVAIVLGGATLLLVFWFYAVRKCT